MDLISLMTGIAIGAGAASLGWIGLALWAMHPRREIEDAEAAARSAG